MAKTHSRFVTITYNSQDISESVDSINGMGIQYVQENVSVLASLLDEFIHGRGQVNLDLSGPFNSATNEAHDVLSSANGVAAGYTLTIQIGDNAAPTTGDPEFEVDGVGTFDYLVQPGGGAVTWSASLRPTPNTTTDPANAWGTV